ncbi:MAG TPA: DUF1444 family protein [Candidatus Limnocylindria bacterium]|nr:DUF1444 family protein [Candidatus Limnocylindria bacterium]
MSWERFDEEPVGALRDEAPDILTPIDDAAPVSGHVPAPEVPRAASATAEHDWAAASDHIFPALRPAGTQGLRLADLDPSQLAQEGLKKHALALVDPGPADLSIVYVLREPAYDVVINADHLLTWGVATETLRDAAMANLRAWSETAPWTDELSGDRRLLSSDTGDGADAARILLPEARAKIAGQCGGPARVLVALPDRDLLIAGSLNPGDGDFASQFATFVADVAAEAHEPIDRGIFELVGDRHELVPFGR